MLCDPVLFVGFKKLLPSALMSLLFAAVFVEDLRLPISATLTPRDFRAGYKPIATCSPKHDTLLRSLGAVSTFDYNDLSCAASIRTQTFNRVKHALDCIADAASVSLCYAAMSRAGGRYACLELPSAAALEARKAVSWRFVMGYEVFGREIALDKGYAREGKEEHRSKAARWAKEVQELMDTGLMKGHSVEVLDGKWEESVPKGLERLRSGEIRGVKLVARVASVAKA